MKKNFFYESFHDKADVVYLSHGGNVLTDAHFHRCIEILYVEEGGIDFEVNGVSFHAEKDDIVFVHKCGIHALKPAPSYRYFVLVIGPRYSEDFAAIFRTKTLPSHLTDRAFNKKLLSCFYALDEIKNISTAQETDRSNIELIKKGYTNVIVGNLLSHYKRVSVSTMPQIETVINVINYIDDHYSEPITLDSISDVFGYNKYYFSRLFNTYIGESLNNYVNMIRIQNIVLQAKKEESPNISELVFANGFDSMTTFYRSFSKMYDAPPSEVFKGAD